MTRFYIIGFFVLMCFDTLAQMGFKFAAIHSELHFPQAFDIPSITVWLHQVLTNYFIYFSVLGYLGAFVTWMTLLKHAPIGPAFAASHLQIVSVVLLSMWLPQLHETLMWPQMVGCLFIMGGIFVLATEAGNEQKALRDTEDLEAASGRSLNVQKKRLNEPAAAINHQP